MCVLPNTSKDEYILLCESIENLISEHYIYNIIIIGDFKLRIFLWIDPSPLRNVKADVIDSSLFNYLDLKQLNNAPKFHQDTLNFIFSNFNIFDLCVGLCLTPIYDFIIIFIFDLLNVSGID